MMIFIFFDRLICGDTHHGYDTRSLQGVEEWDNVGHGTNWLTDPTAD